MPQVTAEVQVPIPPDLAFAVSQTHGPVRHRWDPFIREQYFLDGAQDPGVGVRTYTRYEVRPTWLQRIAHPIGQWLLGREIRKRIDGYARGCRDGQVLAAARADLAARASDEGRRA